MLTRILQRLRRDEGATMVEYGLMVVGVALIAVVGARLLGADLSALFSGILP